MSGRRGRPRHDDSELLGAVREGKARGLTVLQACQELRKKRGNRGPGAPELRKRYEQFRSHYFWFDPREVRVVDRGTFFLRYFGGKPRFKRLPPATLLLTRKPSNKQRAELKKNR